MASDHRNAFPAATELSFFLRQKEERTMLEDTKAALLDLDKVTVFFRQLEDECLVASMRLHQERLTLPIQTTPLLMSSCVIRPTLNKWKPLRAKLTFYHCRFCFLFSGLNRELKQHHTGSINHLKQGHSMRSLRVLVGLVLKIRRPLLDRL